MNETITFGHWLRQRRKALDLTQEDLAELVGCAGETIRKIEAGRRRASRQMAHLLAEYLDIPPEERPLFVQAARSQPEDSSVLHRSTRDLPVPHTTFIGRERQVAAIRTLLERADVRLLTLTGAGGCGKTRLAIQAATVMSRSFDDGVVFISLAFVSDPALVVATIAQCLGVHEVASQSLMESLKGYLSNKQILLVVDTFEHVLPAAPQVADLLDDCLALKVLVTSREPLNLYGEHEFPVPLLTLPDLKHPPALDDLSRYEAVELFLQRARAVKPDFALTQDNAGVVTEICHRLDGLPLSIELASTHIRLLPLQAMLSHLGRRLQLLTGGPRDLPARQQTLRATLEWSYNLLGEGERQLFRQLAVFQGGCTLEGVATVCNAGGKLQIEVMDGLESLISKSLLQQGEVVTGEARFWALDTVSEYAREKLKESGEWDDVHRQHALFYLSLAQQFDEEFRGPGQLEWLDRLELEHDNLRADLDWCAVSEDIETGLSICGALRWFWLVRGYLNEGAKRVRAFLVKVDNVKPPPPPVVYAEALLTAGALANRQGDYEAARSYALSSLTLFRGAANKRGIATAAHVLAAAVGNQGDFTSAIDLCEESIAVAKEIGDKWQVGRTLLTLGISVRSKGGPADLAAAHSVLQQSLSVMREVGDKVGTGYALHNLGYSAQLEGDYRRARSFYRESLSFLRDLGSKLRVARNLRLMRQANLAYGGLGGLSGLHGTFPSPRSRYYSSGQVAPEGSFEVLSASLEESLLIQRELGQERHITLSLQDLGHAAQRQGDIERAAKLYIESLLTCRDLGDNGLVALCLAALGGIAGARRQLQRAARLLGASDALRGALGGVLDTEDRVEFERNVATARGQLDEADWEVAWQEGRAMSMEAAIEYALEEK